MHMMQLGEKLKDPCIKDNTDGHQATRAPSRAGGCSKSVTPNGLHEQQCRSRKADAAKGPSSLRFLSFLCILFFFCLKIKDSVKSVQIVLKQMSMRGHTKTKSVKHSVPKISRALYFNFRPATNFCQLVSHFLPQSETSMVVGVLISS